MWLWCERKSESECACCNQIISRINRPGLCWYIVSWTSVHIHARPLATKKKKRKNLSSLVYTFMLKSLHHIHCSYWQRKEDVMAVSTEVDSIILLDRLFRPLHRKFLEYKKKLSNTISEKESNDKKNPMKSNRSTKKCLSYLEVEEKWIGCDVNIVIQFGKGIQRTVRIDLATWKYIFASFFLFFCVTHFFRDFFCSVSIRTAQSSSGAKWNELKCWVVIILLFMELFR